MDIYREKLLDHYQNPRNFGKKIAADASFEVENTNCGDKVKISLQVEDQIIKDVSYQAEGCAIAIAAASIFSEYLIGKKIEKVVKMDIDKLLDILEVTLTISRIKCAAISLEATQNALQQITKDID